MSDNYHSLLRRQIKKNFADGVAPDSMKPFIDIVNDTYFQFDDDRKMLERTLELSSAEMLESNSSLREVGERLIRHNEILLSLAKKMRSESAGGQKAFNEITESGPSAVSADRCSVWLFNEGKEALVCADLYDSKDKSHKSGIMLTMNEIPGYFSVTDNERIFTLKDLFLDKAALQSEDNWFARNGIVSLMGSPVRMDGKTVGVICFENSSALHEWLPCEMSFAGSLADFVSLTIETAEKKEAQDKHRESEDKYREMIELLPLGIIEYDLDGNIMFYNTSFKELLGYKDPKNGSMPNMFDFLPAEERGKVKENLLKVISLKNTVTNEYTGIRNDKTLISIEATTTPIINKKQVCGFRTVIQDNTTKKKIAAEMLKANKIESIGILAGGIAHDFNNILTAIIGNLSLARFNVPKDSEAYSLIAEAEKAGFVAKNLTKQLLTFSKGGNPIKENTLLNLIITDSTDFILRGTKVSVQYSLTPEMTWVDVDRGQICQVIQNIVINAVQAMPNGGTISVRSEKVFIDADNIFRIKEGNYIKITIKDNGIGIPENIIKNIFDPYFTTKQDGSGLGLSVCYSIVKKHNGCIDVASAPAKGSTFSIYIPSSEINGTSDKTVIKQKVEKKYNSGRILIMDDDNMVRLVGSKLITSMGFDAVCACDGNEAIELYRKALEEKNPFALVILDLTVPGGLGGKDTVEKLQKIDPGIKTVVSSGYSNDPIMSRYRDYGFNDVISKPFDRDHLVEVIDRVLRP